MRAQGGKTPLHFAVLPGIATELLREGADIDARDMDGETPLLAALANDRPEVAQYLIDVGANVNAKTNGGVAPMHLANTLGVAIDLIGAGADLAVKEFRGGNTPLHMSLKKNYPDIAQEILRKGVDVNVRNGSGDAPLHLARDTNITHSLIEEGADVNARNDASNTPLLLAEKVDIAEALIAAGADISVQDKASSPPST